MSSTGEKPGIGMYFRVKCGQRIFLNDNSDRLPPCPNCHGTQFRP